MQKLAGQISRMSIRARVAFGLVCVQRTVSKWGMEDSELNRLLEGLWWYTEREDLSSWGCTTLPEQLSPASIAAIPPERLESLSRLLDELDEIGGGNLFGGFEDTFTLTPTLNLAAILEQEGVVLPPTQPFIQINSRRLWNAWGEPFARAQLRQSLDQHDATA